MSDESSNPFAKVLEDIQLRELGRRFSDPKFLSGLATQLEFAKIGIRVKLGAQKPRNRKHKLHNIIEETFLALQAEGIEASAEQVLDGIRSGDHWCIQEIYDDNTIKWIDDKNNEHTMKFRTLQNCVSRLRKDNISG